MTVPQILIQKAYITVNKAPDFTTIAGSLEPLTISSLGDQVSRLLYPDASRFTSEPDSGIVYDPVTGLQWAQKETEALEWDQASKACSDCRLGGYSDWYLPSRREWESIISTEHFNPCLPPIFEASGDSNWTSTETPWSKKEKRAGSSRSFFFVSMGNGYVLNGSAYGRLRARPVRRAAPASQ